MRIFVGLIGIPLGFVIVYYRERIKRFTGEFEWAERRLGSGGTYTAIFLFGLMITILSLMYMLGTLQTLLYSIFGRFLPGAEPDLSALASPDYTQIKIP